MENQKNSLLEMLNKFTGLLSNKKEQDEKLSEEVAPTKPPLQNPNKATLDFISRHNALSSKIKKR